LFSGGRCWAADASWGLQARLHEIDRETAGDDDSYLRRHSDSEIIHPSELPLRIGRKTGMNPTKMLFGQIVTVSRSIEAFADQ